MARVAVLTILGSLGNWQYESLTEASSYFLQQKAYADSAFSTGQTLYSWEFPPEIIILKINSPGGSTSGMFGAMASIRSLSESGIPVLAVGVGHVCSAGYSLASQADYIIALPGSEFGSIAVAASWEDDSKQREKDGITDYFYSTSSDKITGMPGENKTPEEIKTYLKTSADTTYAEMLTRLEKARPGITQEVNRLNGGSFLVKENSTSPLYDFVATSFEEVLLTLQETDMKNSNFKKFFMGGSVGKISAEQKGSVVATIHSTAEQLQQQATAEATKPESIALLISAAVKAAMPEIINQAKVELAASIAPIKAEVILPAVEKTEVASIESLITYAKAKGIDAETVMNVASLGLTQTQAEKTLLLVSAKQDAKFSQANEGQKTVAEVEALLSEGAKDKNESSAEAMAQAVLEFTQAKLKKNLS